MSAVVVLIETEGDGVGLVSQEALTFARRLGDPVYALVLGHATPGVVADCQTQGVAAIFDCENEELGAYSGAGWAVALASVVEAAGDVAAVVAGGTPRGNEVLAHLAARRDLPMAANVVAVASQPGAPLEVERQVVGGSAIATPDELFAQTSRIERELGRVLGPGSGWSALGMHQLDAQRIGPEAWLACVDGQFVEP